MLPSSLIRRKVASVGLFRGTFRPVRITNQMMLQGGYSFYEALHFMTIRWRTRVLFFCKWQKVQIMQFVKLEISVKTLQWRGCTQMTHRFKWCPIGSRKGVPFKGNAQLWSVFDEEDTWLSPRDDVWTNGDCPFEFGSNLTRVSPNWDHRWSSRWPNRSLSISLKCR